MCGARCGTPANLSGFSRMRIDDSEAIAEIDYRPKRREMVVRFTSGEPYLYFDVPPGEHRAFVQAESKGGYFHEHILNRYRFRKLDS